MSWNIQNFTEKRIHNTNGIDANGTALCTDSSARHLSLILTTINQAQPDLFVLIECLCAKGHQGALVDSNDSGCTGLILLLATLMSSDAAADWRLVPPQRLNQQDLLGERTRSECMGVFWKNANLDFQGPWVNTAAGPKAPANQTAIPYQGAWAACVPAGLQYAGQCLFYDQHAYLRDFPKPGRRSPFLTRFQDRTNNNIYNIYSVHTSPYDAQQAVLSIKSISNIQPVASETNVVIGDMNVDLNKDTILAQESIRNFGAMQLVRTRKILNEQRWAQTMFYSTSVAQPFVYFKNEALDYAFVGFGPNVAPPIVPRIDRINRVYGNPAPYTCAMQVSFNAYLNPNDPHWHQTPSTYIFRAPVNFGHIGPPAAFSPPYDKIGSNGTSDHAPILLDQI